ncbi:hypothetical protein HG536_0D00290 [Torulaspora globosa]|uniref:Uncharacterized protein n=1 Tax=Torulaspora globosa TaxID=48254 RepID=A0A7G3ZG71_9SACH|nr:uncharacterized protein HG536_0D00290 [Torulaspora globosa]QLL32507.1 hypothetical protein HG536_0D00290 [Torulaspora globosa]
MSSVSPDELPVEVPEKVFPGQLICPEFGVKQQAKNDIVYKFVSGQGTQFQEYQYEGSKIKAIVSTLVGNVAFKAVQSPRSDNDEDSSADKRLLEIDTRNRTVVTIEVSVLQKNSKFEDRNVNDDFANNLPKEGDIVLTRVTKISQQRANVEILAVENQPVPIDSGVGSNGSGIVAAQGGSGAATFSISQASSDLGETFRGLIRSQDVRATERDTVKIIDCFKPGDIVRAQVLSLGDGTNYYLSTARNDLGVVFARAFNGCGGLMYAVDWQTMAAPSTGTTEKRKCARPF